jgi:exopolyphosphatase/guanosine-5'-triphosphate,3'-diphosphate pyrophosphatase
VSPAIVPRWEWRTFAERFGDVDERFDVLSPESVHESDETYVLSLSSDASVKVRDGLVDVKVIEDVSADGLERWRPVLKADYPLAADEVGLLTNALAIAAAQLERAEYSREQLVEEVLRPTGELMALQVHKRRAHYLIAGCMAERSEVRVEQGIAQTIGIESEDPDLVRATVRELGLHGRGNVSLPRELKVLVGFGAP